MTVHKFTSSLEVDNGSEAIVPPYSLSQYLRRPSEEFSHSDKPAYSNWGFKINQQRHLSIALLIAMAIYCGFLSYDLLSVGRTLEGVGLLVLMAAHVLFVRRQIRSSLNWPAQLVVAASILLLYS